MYVRERSRKCITAIFVLFAISVLLIYVNNAVTIYRQLTILNKTFVDDKNLETSTINAMKNVENTIDEIRSKSETPISPANFFTSPETMAFLQKIILNSERLKIAQALEDFNYTEQMVGLSELTPETYGNPVRSVLSTWRSGSSFFGDILNSMPATYYHFEPLMFMNDIQIRNDATDAIEAIQQLLKCNYSSSLYLRRSIFRYNERLWKYCSAFEPFHLCQNLDFLNQFCSLFPFQSLKEVRLRASVCEPLLMDPESNIKIILLVRDPRGVYNSRKHAHWCLVQGIECRNASNLCNDMVSDFKAAYYLTKKYPNRFRVIRYEDLSLDPFNVTADILRFYGLPFHKNVKKFLTTHTTVHRGNIMSRFRVSTETVFAWRSIMPFSQVDHIQAQCEDAINLWGYNLIMHEDDLKNGNFNVLAESPFDSEGYMRFDVEYRVESNADDGEEKEVGQENEDGDEEDEENKDDSENNGSKKSESHKTSSGESRRVEGSSEDISSEDINNENEYNQNKGDR